MKKFKLYNLVLSGMIAALYAGITYAFGSLSYWNGLFQIRPAEALTILPLLFIEAVPGLFIGCMLANIMSTFGIMDIVLGSLITLVAAILTRLLKKVQLGVIPPIILNAALLPLVFMLAGESILYWEMFISLFLTQSIWIIGLGIPLFYSVKKLKPMLYKNFENRHKKVELENDDESQNKDIGDI